MMDTNRSAVRPIFDMHGCMQAGTEMLMAAGAGITPPELGLSTMPGVQLPLTSSCVPSATAGVPGAPVRSIAHAQQTCCAVALVVVRTAFMSIPGKHA